MGICLTKAASDVEMDVNPSPSILDGSVEEAAAKGESQPKDKARKPSITETLMMEHRQGKGQRMMDEVYDTSDAIILGEGMSGRVATCRQRYTGELFALKTLSVQRLKVDMDELRQEIDILKRLDHPNIVKVYETFEEEGRFHVVMELCSGGQVETHWSIALPLPYRALPGNACAPPRARPRAPQLISRLKSHKRGFGEEMAARLMSKMIASILYCHERNVCHRDVKLDNFVYESDGADAELELVLTPTLPQHQPQP